MELILYFAAVMAVGSVTFLVLCGIYFAVVGHPIILAVKLSWKLAFGAVAGLLLLGFGAILVPAIWINGALDGLPSYSKWRDIIAAVVIATIGAVVTYIVVFAFAFEMLG